jgi:hypothetical protein
LAALGEADARFPAGVAVRVAGEQGGQGLVRAGFEGGLNGKLVNGVGVMLVGVLCGDEKKGRYFLFDYAWRGVIAY